MAAERLTIEIELGNAEMQSAWSAAQAINKALIRQASSTFSPLRQHEAGAIRDANGNTVGKWEVT